MSYSALELRFFKTLAHAIFTGQTDSEGFVSVEWMSQFFPETTVKKLAREFMYGHEDETGETNFGEGLLWLRGHLRQVDRETDTIVPEAIAMFGFTFEQDLADKAGIEILQDFIPIFGTEEDEAARVRKDPAFQEWLANVWQDPTGDVKTKSAKTGREVTVQTTSLIVEQLSYSPAEAVAAKARVDQHVFGTRARAAYKAHITRRTVGA